MEMPYFFYLLRVDGHLGCFYFFTTPNNAARVSCTTSCVDSVFVVSSTKSGIDESDGNFVLNTLGNCRAASQSSWTVRFQQHCMRVPTSPLPCLTRVITCLTAHSHLVPGKWHLFVGFIFISSRRTMLSIFSLLAIYIPFMEKCLFKSFANFQLDYLTFSH